MHSLHTLVQYVLYNNLYTQIVMWWTTNHHMAITHSSAKRLHLKRFVYVNVDRDSKRGEERERENGCWWA